MFVDVQQDEREQNEKESGHLDETRKEAHEAELQDVFSTIENTINPFELDQTEMVHLTSGVVANEKVKNDLLNVKKIGEERLCAFVETNLLSEEPIFLLKSRKQSCKHSHR